MLDRNQNNCTWDLGMSPHILAELVVELRVVHGRSGLAVVTSEARLQLISEFVVSDPPVWFELETF